MKISPEFWADSELKHRKWEKKHLEKQTHKYRIGIIDYASEK